MLSVRPVMLIYPDQIILAASATFRSYPSFRGVAKQSR